MRDALKKLSGDSLIYGIGQVGNRAVNVLMVPILTRVLRPGEYAISELAFAYSQAVILVLVMGLDGALARFFYHEPDRAARVRMASSSLIFRVITSVLIAVLIAALSGPLAAQFMGGPAYRKYLLVAAATLPFTLLVLFGNDVLRVTLQPIKFVTLNSVNVLLVFALSFLFVVVQHRGVIGVLYGKLIGDGASALLALVLSRHALRWSFDRTVLRKMLAYGLPAVPAIFAFGVVASIDRFALQRTRSLEEVAIYGIAAKFLAVVAMGVSAFQLAYTPFAYSRLHQPEAPRLFAKFFALYVAGASGAALLVGLLAPTVLELLVPPAYRAAATPALWLAFAAVAQGAYTVASIGIGIALKTPWLNASGLAAAAVGVMLQWALTPRLGPVGAAAATCAAYFAAAAVTYAIAQRVYWLPYRGGRVIALGLLALGLGLAGQRFAPPGALGLVTRLAIAAAYAGLVLWLRVWTNAFAVGPPRDRPSEER